MNLTPGADHRCTEEWLELAPARSKQKARFSGPFVVWNLSGFGHFWSISMQATGKPLADRPTRKNPLVSHGIID
jgi:hypothetical protein